MTIPDPLSSTDLELLPQMNAVRARWKKLRELVLAEIEGSEACRDAPFGEKDWLDRRWDPDERGNERLAFLATLSWTVRGGKEPAGQPSRG